MSLVEPLRVLALKQIPQSALVSIEFEFNALDLKTIPTSHHGGTHRFSMTYSGLSDHLDFSLPQEVDQAVDILCNMSEKELSSYGQRILISRSEKKQPESVLLGPKTISKIDVHYIRGLLREALQIFDLISCWLQRHDISNAMMQELILWIYKKAAEGNFFSEADQAVNALTKNFRYTHDENHWAKSIKTFIATSMHIKDLASSQKSHLTSLYISGYLMNGKGLSHLSHWLVNNESLKKLSIINACMGVAGFCKLIQGLKLNKTVKALDFTNNDLNDCCRLAIKKCLNYYTNSQESFFALRSEVQKIYGDTVGSALLLDDLFSTNRTVIQLVLDANQIQNNNARLLMKAFSNNRTVKMLSLNQNNINGDCILSLNEMLEKNKALSVLELRKNPLPVGALRSCGEALKNNFSLTRFDVPNGYENSIFGPYKKDIEPCLNRNKKYQVCANMISWMFVLFEVRLPNRKNGASEPVLPLYLVLEILKLAYVNETVLTVLDKKPAQLEGYLYFLVQERKALRQCIRDKKNLSVVESTTNGHIQFRFFEAVPKKTLLPETEFQNIPVSSRAS